MKPASVAIGRRDALLVQRRIEAAELVHKRTANSKTFRLQTGEMHLTQTAGALHFDRGNGLEEIELSWKRTKGGWRSEDAAPIITAFVDRVGWRHESRSGWWAEMELLTVNGVAPVVKHPVPDDHVLVYSSVAQGVDIRLELLRDGAEAFKVLMQATELVWRVAKSDNFDGEINVKPTGVDAEGNSLEIQAELVGNILTERWTGRVSRVSDENTRRKQWFTNPVLPVVVDASINEHIVANADDGTEINNGFWNIGGQDILVGTAVITSTNRYDAGLRFQTISVPAGATVTAATLTIYVSNWVGTPTVKLYADDVDDAAAWSASNKPSGITKTSASASMTITASSGSQVFDILSVVQEVLGRGGWASGNDIRFGIFHQGSFKRVIFDAIERAGTNEAQLDITYTESGGGASAVPVIMRQYRQRMT